MRTSPVTNRLTRFLAVSVVVSSARHLPRTRPLVDPGVEPPLLLPLPLLPPLLPLPPELGVSPVDPSKSRMLPFLSEMLADAEATERFLEILDDWWRHFA